MRSRHARTDQTESDRRNNEFILFFFTLSVFILVFTVHG